MMGLVRPNDAGGQRPLEGNRQGIEPHGYNGEQAHRHKTLDDIEGCLFDIAASVGVFDRALKGADDQADGEKCPAQLTEKLNNGLHPLHLEQFHSHATHHGEEAAHEADDLIVCPVDDGVEDGGGHKVPYKHITITSF